MTLAAAAGEASSGEPLALRVEVQALGRGAEGTVMGVVVQVAPEDRERLGERVRISLALRHGSELIDQHGSVIAFEQDGTALLHREWPLGSYQLEAVVTTFDGSSGLWIGDIEVPHADLPFIAPDGAAPDAVALAVTPPLEGAVRFLPPPELGGIGGLQLELEVPATTSMVEFFRDGSSLGRRNRPPWTISVAMGEMVRRSVITAEARDATGRLLGEDAIVLNTPTGQLGVEVLLGEETADGGRRVTVAVSGAERLQQVTLNLDDVQVARWLRCPCVTELPLAELEEVRVIVADAIDARGYRGDGVLHLQGGGSFSGAVRVELVELPVTVLGAAGQPLPGLARGDFRVFEDEVEVETEGFGTTADLPLSLAITVDISGSMEEVFPTVRRVVTDFSDNLLEPGDEVTLLTFSWEPRVAVKWTDRTENLEPAMERLVPEGGTSLLDSVVASLEQFRGRRGRQALVLLTDGSDTASLVTPQIAVRYAHTMRIPVFSIGLGVSRLDFEARGIMRKLATQTGGETFFPGKVEELPAVYDRIDELLRSQYVLWYSSPSEKPVEEFRAIRVELTRSEGTVRTISGYYPGK